MTALLENLWSAGILERWGWVLVHGLWQAAVVAALLAVLLRLLREAGPDVRYALACAALALMLALPLVTLRFLPVGGLVAEAGPAPVAVVLPPPNQGATPKHSLSVLDTDRIPGPQDALNTRLGALPPAQPAAPTTSVPLRERIGSVLTPALPYVVLGWLVGVCGLSVWHLGGWTQLQRLRRRMVRAVGSPPQQSLEELSARLGVHRTVGLLESALAEVPTVVGWVRPVILLPASALTGLSPEQLAAILAHELAHVRRYDYLVNMLQTVVEILGFYHPAVWWVSHRIRVERENCCDDVAVQVCGSPVQYARALACMEEIRHHGTELALAATGGSLLARIARLLGRPAVTHRRFAWLPGLVALLLVVGLLLPAALVLGTPQPSPAVEPAPAAAAHSLADINGAPSNSESTRGSSDREAARILLDFKVIKVSDDLRLGYQTALMMADGLGVDSQFAREFLRPGRKIDMTVGEILKRYIVPESLSEKAVDTIVSLLGSRGYLVVLAAPRIEVYNGHEATMRAGNERFLPGSDPSAKVERIEYGTAVNATPHVLDNNRVLLELKTEVSDLVPGADANQPVVARTSAETSVTARNDRYLIWAAAESPAKTATPGKGRESLYIMVRPVIQADNLISPRAAASVPDSGPRQVLLDVRTVTIQRNDLLNLGVEWGWPKIQAGVFGNPGGPPPNAGAAGGWPQGVQIGCTPDRTFTDALLAALDLLRKNNQATVSMQQILAQDGCKAQIKTLTEEWLPATAATPQSGTKPYRIETGTIVTVTPHASDTNNITLQIGVESSDRVPMARGGSALPVITRRTTKNAVMLKDGGTVALAGVTTPPADPNDKTAYETAIFVTALLVSESATLPETTTRRIRLNYVQPAQAQALIAPSLAPYVQVEPSRTRDPNDEGNTLIVTGSPQLMDRVVQDVKRIDRVK
jgi:type II secretory pathway component GspD/PulD (secretin)/beta-lactamase regulating signal transducer with metallopeptidase domain